LLLVGRSGLGKVVFAREFIKGALCEAATGDGACDKCRSCILWEAGNHPDCREVVPEETGKGIAIDQIRDLIGYFSLTSHYRRGKTALIAPADAMNRAAANALLKCLEEPPPGALIILVADRLDSVPPTVRSRCHRIGFDAFDAGSACDWLAQRLPDMSPADIQALLGQASGAPLRAVDLATRGGGEILRQVTEFMRAVGRGDLDAMDAAQKFPGADIDLLIDAAMRVVYGFMLQKLGRQASYGPWDRADEDMHGLGDQLEFKHLFEFFDVLLETRGLLVNRASVREIDLMEGLWLSWSSATRRHGVEA
jgi:DNA polymerase-3 subunit delta'